MPSLKAHVSGLPGMTAGTMGWGRKKGENEIRVYVLGRGRSHVL